MTNSRSVAVGFAAGAAAVLLGALVVALIAAYSGAYNVAATEDHTAFGRWTLTTTMENSIKGRAAAIEAPARFSDEMVAAGAPEYKAMCQHCHGGPGMKPDGWSRGMLPQPPHLAEVVDEWQANEVFWLVKHGLKMTGMPSFGQTHDDQTIWNLTAFAIRLPGMTAAEYNNYPSPEAGGHPH